MKNSWVLWGVIVGVVVVVLIAFNYQGHQDTVSLSELFPEEDAKPVDMEYEFVTEGNEVKDVTMKMLETPVVEDVKSAVQAKAAPVVSQVQAAAPVVKTQAVNVPAAASSSGSDLSGVKFTIQVASVQKRSGAEEVVKKLEKDGVSAFIVSKDLGAKGVWYRVYTGRFSTKAEADASLGNIQKSYSGSFVISPTR